MDDINELGKILCIFCSAPWTPENIKIYEADDACSAGTPIPMILGVEIACHSCKRVMYRKTG